MSSTFQDYGLSRNHILAGLDATPLGVVSEAQSQGYGGELFPVYRSIAGCYGNDRSGYSPKSHGSWPFFATTLPTLLGPDHDEAEWASIDPLVAAKLVREYQADPASVSPPILLVNGDAGKDYLVIEGIRRALAALHAGAEEYPVIVVVANGRFRKTAKLNVTAGIPG